MAKLIKEVVLVKTLMTEVTSAECANVLFAYQKLDETYTDNKLKLFGRALFKLNTLSLERGHGYFISKPINSDEELLKMAEEAYDTFNTISAEHCNDSYVQQDSTAM